MSPNPQDNEKPQIDLGRNGRLGWLEDLGAWPRFSCGEEHHSTRVGALGLLGVGFRGFQGSSQQEHNRDPQYRRLSPEQAVGPMPFSTLGRRLNPFGFGVSG